MNWLRVVSGISYQGMGRRRGVLLKNQQKFLSPYIHNQAQLNPPVTPPLPPRSPHQSGPVLEKELEAC